MPIVAKVPWLFGFSAMTLFPWLVLFKKGMPELNIRHLMLHEGVHIRQQLRYSWAYSVLRYFLDNKWRGFLECEAYAMDVKLLMKGGRNGQEMMAYYANVLREKYHVDVSDTVLQQEIARWVRHGN